MFNETYRNDAISLQAPPPNSKNSQHPIWEPLIVVHGGSASHFVSLEPLLLFRFAFIHIQLLPSYHHILLSIMTHNTQIVHTGLSKNYLSLERPGHRAKQQLLVSQPGHKFKHNQILKRLCELDEKKYETSAASEHVEDAFDSDAPAVGCDMDWEDEPAEHHYQVPKEGPKRRKQRDLKADTKAQYDAWKEIVPLLVQPLLSYIGASSGSPTTQKVDIPLCTLCDGQKTSQLLCLHWDRKQLWLLSCVCI